MQGLKHRLATEWVRELQRMLDIRREQLPLLWDCDFLHAAVASSALHLQKDGALKARVAMD